MRHVYRDMESGRWDMSTETRRAVDKIKEQVERPIWGACDSAVIFEIADVLDTLMAIKVIMFNTHSWDQTQCFIKNNWRCERNFIFNWWQWRLGIFNSLRHKFFLLYHWTRFLKFLMVQFSLSSTIFIL